MSEALGPLASVLTVLALLGGMLYWLRSKGYARPLVGGSRQDDTLPMRLAGGLRLTPQHSLHLVRIGAHTFLVAASPGGCTIQDLAFPQGGEASPKAPGEVR
jgi:Flagellar biosynthesis protein, FliO